MLLYISRYLIWYTYQFWSWQTLQCQCLHTYRISAPSWLWIPIAMIRHNGCRQCRHITWNWNMNLSYSCYPDWRIYTLRPIVILIWIVLSQYSFNTMLTKHDLCCIHTFSRPGNLHKIGKIEGHTVIFMKYSWQCTYVLMKQKCHICQVIL